MTPMINSAYSDAYPKDPLRRQALEACFDANHGFNRLWAAERAGCYERQIPTAFSGKEPQIRTPAANFVDLYQSAGRGRVPQNDIRYQQQSAEALRQIRSAHN